MDDILNIIERVVPQLSAELAQRVRVMQLLAHHSERLGRKALAQKVGLSERTLRTLIDSLRQQGLVDVTQAGMQLTHYGELTLKVLEELLEAESPYFELAQRLKQRLGIAQCYVVSGNADEQSSVGERLGRMVTTILQELLPKGRQVIAMTGGTTLAHVAHQFDQTLSYERELVFVPARGGVGGSYDIQSNSIGGLMAKQTNGLFVPLFIPENMQESTSRILLNDPTINYAVELSKTADCLLLSVGNANIMAERHDLTEQQKKELVQQQAVGEAFGVFFNQAGQEVLRLPKIGVQLEALQQVPLLVTVVGGASKAKAIQAYYKLVQHHGILVCDEGIANMVLSGD